MGIAVLHCSSRTAAWASCLCRRCSAVHIPVNLHSDPNGVCLFLHLAAAIMAKTACMAGKLDGTRGGTLFCSKQCRDSKSSLAEKPQVGEGTSAQDMSDMRAGEGEDHHHHQPPPPPPPPPPLRSPFPPICWHHYSATARPVSARPPTDVDRCTEPPLPVWSICSHVRGACQNAGPWLRD